MKASELINELRGIIMYLEMMLFEGVIAKDEDLDVESILCNLIKDK